jgi:hypothetical protein
MPYPLYQIGIQTVDPFNKVEEFHTITTYANPAESLPAPSVFHKS